MSSIPELSLLNSGLTCLVGSSSGSLILPAFHKELSARGDPKSASLIVIVPPALPTQHGISPEDTLGLPNRIFLPIAHGRIYTQHQTPYGCEPLSAAISNA